MIDKATIWELMKDFIYASIKGLMMKYGAYEPNNLQTWKNIEARVREFTEKLVPTGHLSDCKVVCDGTINTDETVDANECHLKFFWKVNENDEFTEVDFDIMPDQGCVYSEVSVGVL